MTESTGKLFTNHYQVLQVSPGCSEEEIKKAYRALAKAYHPDLNPSLDTAEQFIQLQESYEVLIDPVRRKDFDRLLQDQSFTATTRSYSTSTGSGATSNGSTGTRARAGSTNRRTGGSAGSRSRVHDEPPPPPPLPKKPPFWREPPSSANFASLSKRLAAEANREADYYRLGAPYHYYSSKYIDWDDWWGLIWWSICTILSGMAVLLAIVGCILAVLYGTVGNWSSMVAGLVTWTVLWGAVLFRSLAGFNDVRQDIMREYTLHYECIHGFFVVERKSLKRRGKVTLVVKWPQLQQLSYYKVPHFRGYYQYWIVIENKKVIELRDQELWCRALDEFMLRHPDYSVQRDEEGVITWYIK